MPWRIGFFSPGRYFSRCATTLRVAKDVLRGTKSSVARWEKTFCIVKFIG
jgi:hypothetical protein